MLSKSLIKLVNSLSLKKYRQKHNLFVVEGQKLVSDLLRMNVNIKHIISCNNDFTYKKAKITYASRNEMKKISNFKTPSDIIALAEIPDYKFSIDNLTNKLSLALDEIQNPGNMGTIVRIANWFGIENIICSENCADIYNPKVVQSSMGAIMGVKVHYVNLPETIRKLKRTSNHNVYGTFMSGENIYTSKLSSSGIIVMGNEGQGVSDEISKLVDIKLSIPANTSTFTGSESLNVAVAAGIVVSEFNRGRFVNH